MVTRSTSAATTSDREIVITRVFDAPRELVWDAWTKPEHIAQWWGPNGFTNTIEEMDVRPGGVFRLVMHGPDGTDYPNRIIFREVTKPEHLEYSHGSGTDDGVADFEVTVTFGVQGKGTRITMRSVFVTKEARDHMVNEFGAIEGAKQTLERLAQYLAKQQ